MSLPAFSTQGELFSTTGLSGTFFAAADRYWLFAKKVYPVLVQLRSQLEVCYCAQNGRAAVEPVLLLGVSLLQYLEAVPDRQAVDLLHYHAGWNFALNRQLGDELFHPTTLVNFRQRLLDHDLSGVSFQGMLEALVAAGLVARQSRQRLDSTQMLGRVSRMNRLDCVRESLRLALEELAQRLPPEQRPAWWSGLWERYGESQTDYRASLETLARKLVEVGAAVHQLLEWLAGPAAGQLGQGPQARLLARVFAEQFEVGPGAGAPQPKAKQQLGTERVQNPHDPDATYASKGHGEQSREHVGYKVQVAETVSQAVLAPGEPTRNFVAGLVTHSARESDEEGAEKMATEQKALGMDKPPVQYVDAAYISAEKLVEAAAEGRELIGPAPGAPNNNDGHFTTEAFQVSVEAHRAICPAAHPNTQCSRLAEQATGRISYRFEWDTATCAGCPLRSQCIQAAHRHRTLIVGAHHTALQARRREQRTPAFRQRMKHRRLAWEMEQSGLAIGLSRASIAS